MLKYIVVFILLCGAIKSCVDLYVEYNIRIPDFVYIVGLCVVMLIYVVNDICNDQKKLYDK